MPTEADVMALFERANPVPDPDAIDIVVSADQRLATALHEESSTMTVIEPTTTGTPEPEQRRWLIPVAAAAVLVVVLVAGLAIFGNDDTVPSDSVPTTTAPAPTTTTTADESAEQPTTADLAVVDAFFNAYNDGDTDAVLALLTDDIAVTEQYGGAFPDPDDEPFPQPDQQLAWKHAQGENITDPTCLLAAEQPEEGATLRCEYTTLDAFVRAVEGAPIPTRALITIVDGEIAELHQGYGNPDYSAQASRFRRWIEQNHPDRFDSLFADWTSRAEAAEQGRRRAQWAQEWAFSLSAIDESAILAEVPRVSALAAAADGETQRTIVGDITWTRVDGDASTQPSLVDYELLGEYYGSDDGDRITWRSPDGLTWTQIDPVEPARGVVETGGGIWAVQFEPGVRGDWVLVRWDGTSFVPFELPPSRAPTVDGLSSSGRRLSLAAFGDQLAVVASEAYSVPWSDFLGAGAWFPEVDDDGTIRVRDVRNGSSVQLEVTADESDPARIHLLDDGRLVTSIGPWPGLDAESLVASLGNLSHNELLIGGPGGFEPVPLPAVESALVQLVELDGRLLALYRRLSPTGWGFELWVGGQDADWARLGLPAPIGEVLDHVAIASDGRSLLVTIVSSQPGQVAEAWHTNDGETWQVANGAASFGSVRAADFGWMTDNVFEDPSSIAVSPDGITWQEISVDLLPPEDDPSEGSGGGKVDVFGNTIILSWFEEFGDRSMWIGRVEPG